MTVLHFSVFSPFEMELKNATIQKTEGMQPYINFHKPEIDFKQRALLLYPFIQLYGSMGIPYIDMTEEELEQEIKSAMLAAM